MVQINNDRGLVGLYNLANPFQYLDTLYHPRREKSREGRDNLSSQNTATLPD